VNFRPRAVHIFVAETCLYVEVIVNSWFEKVASVVIHHCESLEVVGSEGISFDFRGNGNY
jgi:hypothetical protein